MAQVPSLCSEVKESVFGRLIPISVTQCHLLTRLLNRSQKPTTGRLCKQICVSKPAKQERSVDTNFGGKSFRSIPVAEFVDINRLLRKYRRKFMHERKGMGLEKVLIETGEKAHSPVEDSRSERKVEVPGGLACDNKTRVEVVDAKSGNEVCNVGKEIEFKYMPSKFLVL